MADDKLVHAITALVETLEERSADLPPCERIQMLSEEEVEAFERLYPILYVKVNRTFGKLRITNL